jgi:hypothetical protein
VNHLGAIAIISGGQTGADRAALDFAIDHGLPHDGWCPRGRLAEDGPLDERYQLRETPSRRYAERTEWNVRDSDATVVFSLKPKVSGGTALTVAMAERLGKPCLHLARGPAVVDGTIQIAASELRQFIDAHQVIRLNVAGPRASQEPEIAEFVQDVLQSALVRSNS